MSIRVAVDGATGYLGNHVVAALMQQANVEVRCIVRPESRAVDRSLLSWLRAEVVEAEMRANSESLQRALSGCDVAVHLIGSIAPPKGETLEELHSGQTSALVAAAKAAGVKKLVQVTALGTAKDAISTYHQTKWLAEDHIRKSAIPFVILRPSLIIGRTVGSRNSKLVARYMDLIKTRPRVPLIGGGQNKIQPIYVEDLANAIVRSVMESAYDNQIHELGGNEILSMQEFVEKLIQLQRVDKPVTPIPPVLANLMAAACETFQNVPLISRDQVKLSSQDNVCSKNAINTVFGIKPTSVDGALSTYMVPAKMMATGRSLS